MTDAAEIVAPEVFRRYIALADSEPVRKALRKNTRELSRFLDRIPKKKRNFAYAEGKWTVKELLQHMIDAERVFAYRALWFARRDGQPLPGFDENLWAQSARVSARHWSELKDELLQVRKATELLFDSFNEDDLNATGTSNNNVLNVRALAYVCAGHAAHHIAIIKERYLKKN